MKDNKFVLAIDWGHTNLRMALVKIIKDKYEIKNLTVTDCALVKDHDSIFKLIDVTFSKSLMLKVDGIAVSTAGAVDNKRKLILLSEVPPGGYALKQDLEERYDKKVILINDANAGVYAEKYFGNNNAENLIYITISSGIGAGIISDSKLLTGENGAAGEIGRLLIGDPRSEIGLCTWESVASGNKLPQYFGKWADRHKKIVEPHTRAKEIFELYRQGEKNAVHFINDLNKLNSMIVSNMIMTYNPETIVFGGSVMVNNGDILLSGLLKFIKSYLPIPKMHITSLGDNVCLLGAAAYFKEFNAII